MKTKFTITTIVFALAAFFLTRVIWPDLPDAISPTATQLPLFIILSIFESVAFGLGISFLVFGWPRLKAAFPEYKAVDRLAFLGIVWAMISWWPHDNMHRVTEEGDYAALLGLEYGFHVTLIIAAVLVAAFVWKIISAKISERV